MTAALLERWRAEEREQPSGWSFTDLEDRMSTEPPPWDFAAICADALATAQHALDMGTGGGETLFALRDAVRDSGRPWPHTTATEGWPPNIAVAATALAPAGIDVIDFGQPDDDGAAPAPMPFGDAVFDLVLSRHEAYHPLEITRVLTPGGVFLTQQVGGDGLVELHELLGSAAATPHVQHGSFMKALTDAGLHVTDGAEHVGRVTFTDVAALIAYLQRVPWEVPTDFTVDRYADALLALHARTAGGPVTMTSSRFWIRAEAAPA